LRTVFDVGKKQERIKELEREIQRPDLWKDREKAIKITQELSELQKEVSEFEDLKLKLAGLGTEKEIETFEKKFNEKELQIFLSGKYDRGSAILSIFAGAGGQDAQDWATMLLRMYERYSQRKGYENQVLHQFFGEGGGPEGRIGIKQVSLEIKGNYAYGFLKKESGVHRLVRISPFSAKQLRHTSFALVEVLPELSKTEESETKIKPEELKIDYYRASGPGGQYVNKRETAVRIIHLPTQITVSCQSERLQGMNRDKAMKILISKLHQLKEEKTQKELKEIKGKVVSASWGNQIRSYVLHPYKLVKDLRTGVEVSDIESVLDGNLDKFIEAEIKWKNGKI